MHKHSFNLSELFELVCDTTPNQECLVFKENRYTYKDIDSRANQIAHYLRSIGIKKDDNIGLFLYNCNQYIEAMLACFKIRAVPININYRYVGAELKYLFQNADLVACFHEDDMTATLKEIQSEIPLCKTFVNISDNPKEENTIGSVYYDEIARDQSTERDFEGRSDDDLFILYTGGTTGYPKGVVWTHKSVLYGGMGGAGHYRPDGPIEKPEQITENLSSGTVIFPLAPLMHGAAWWSSCIALLAGQTIIYNDQRSLNASYVLELVAREKVNIITLVGDAMAVPLLQEFQKKEDMSPYSSLYCIGSGGAVFSDDTQESLKKLFNNNIFLLNNFGSSETGLQGSDNGQNQKGLGSVQRCEHADVIVDGRYAEVGEEGYLARSGYTPIAYYNDPKKSAETFITIDGKPWALAGDRAFLDPDHNIVILGRGSNCINSGGEKIFPEEVEIACMNHPSVADCNIVSTKDPRFHERVVAVVELNKGASLDLASLQEETRKHIAGYKIPRELYIVDKLQRYDSGKPDYKWSKNIVENNEPSP